MWRIVLIVICSIELFVAVGLCLLAVIKLKQAKTSEENYMAIKKLIGAVLAVCLSVAGIILAHFLLLIAAVIVGVISLVFIIISSIDLG